MRNASKRLPANKLRVVFVIDDSLDRPDGVQQATLSLGRYLSRQGHDVQYITSTAGPDSGPNVHAFARVLRLNFNGNRLGTPYRTDVRRLRAFLAKQTFDIAHVQTPYSPLLAGRVIRQAACPNEGSGQPARHAARPAGRHWHQIAQVALI